jgi:endonuclease-3
LHAVTPALAASVELINAMEEKSLADLIHPVGFYNTKAKNIKKAAALLLQNWGGEVPVNEKDLVSLPGAAAAAAAAASLEVTCRTDQELVRRWP